MINNSYIKYVTFYVIGDPHYWMIQNKEKIEDFPSPLASYCVQKSIFLTLTNKYHVLF